MGTRVIRKRSLLRGVPSAALLALACAWALVAPAPPASAGSPPIAPPSSIPADCSRDVTSVLNAWFAGLGANASVSLPPHACYLVSDIPGSTLRLHALHGVSINGNGAVFEQASYDNGHCGSNNVQPVLWLTANDHLTIDNLDLRGPGTCNGASNEGDYGLLMGQNGTGNSNVTLSGVTVEDTGGDGLAILPLLGTGTGINWNIVFENGHFTNIGYHVLTLEGVNGLTFAGNAVSGFRNFADLEVDNSCVYSGPSSGCYDSTGTPTSTAQWNVTIKGNTFTNATGFGNWIESEQGTCIPQKNLDIENNTLDGSVDGTIVLTGSGGSCPTDSNLTIVGNTSTAPSLSPCGGSIAAPPSCALMEISDYSGVTISGNAITAFDGLPGYFPNTPYTPCIALGAVHAAWVTHNTCNNTLLSVSTAGLQFPPANGSNSSLTRCGNTYGLTEPVAPAGTSMVPAAHPLSDGACSGSPSAPPSAAAGGSPSGTTPAGPVGPQPGAGPGSSTGVASRPVPLRGGLPPGRPWHQQRFSGSGSRGRPR